MDIKKDENSESGLLKIVVSEKCNMYDISECIFGEKESPLDSVTEAEQEQIGEEESPLDDVTEAEEEQIGEEESPLASVTEAEQEQIDEFIEDDIGKDIEKKAENSVSLKFKNYFQYKYIVEDPRGDQTIIVLPELEKSFSKVLNTIKETPAVASLDLTGEQFTTKMIGCLIKFIEKVGTSVTIILDVNKILYKYSGTTQVAKIDKYACEPDQLPSREQVERLAKCLDQTFKGHETSEGRDEYLEIRQQQEAIRKLAQKGRAKEVGIQQSEGSPQGRGRGRVRRP